ncbi:MAG: S-layer homology domain-containing protein, partial [Clostridiales bacterium]|nr:S-layer homology domain-containing protein [Clostridiales bacterium]
DTVMLKGIIRTGFSDDSSIPAWAKPYVSTALMSGIITGFKDDEGRLVFAAQEPVTFCEAAVVLDNLLKIPDVAAVSAMAQDTCPAWSYQAETNLTACDIMPVMGTACGENVTRADAAEMLVAALDIIKDRDGGSLLLKWAK